MELERDTLLVPDARTEVVSQGPWLLGAFSQHGAGHVRQGLPNGDAYRIGRSGNAVIVAVADGVSSAPLGDFGAQLAVTIAVERSILHVRTRASLNGRALEPVFTYVRVIMEAKAHMLGRPIEALATTLLLAVLTENSATIAKIGDGSVMAVEEDRSGAQLVPLVDCPHVGQGVVDLTHRDWRRNLRQRHIPDLAAAGIATLALATDGAGGYLMTSSKTPTVAGPSVALSTLYLHEGLGKALVQRTARDMIGYFAQLLFLESQKDPFDDRTLVVATRRPARRLE